jgi:hypothetical protein
MKHRITWTKVGNQDTDHPLRAGDGKDYIAMIFPPYKTKHRPTPTKWAWQVNSFHNNEVTTTSGTGNTEEAAKKAAEQEIEDNT